MLNRKISRDRAVAELISRVGPYGGIFFTWLIAHLDREGRVDGDVPVLKGMVVPRIPQCTAEVISNTLRQAQDLGLLVWYEAKGDRWVAYPKFQQNQIGLRIAREPESEIPEPPPNGAVTEPTQRQLDATMDPDCLQDGALREGKGIEGKGIQSVKNEVDDPDIRRVLNHYLDVYPENEIQADQQGARLIIRKRLDAGYTADQLCSAIDGNKLDEWYQSQKLTGVRQVFKNAETIDKFIATAEQPEPEPPKPTGAWANEF